MGRAIRKVPLDWEHPRNEQGDYIPLYDDDWESGNKDWFKANDEFMALSEDERLKEYGCLHYWDYESLPVIDCYRTRVWSDSEATGYQIYETVSEGTPVSPIFQNLEDLTQWLIGEGYSEKAARNFASLGVAISVVMTSSGIFKDIHTLDI